MHTAKPISLNLLQINVGYKKPRKYVLTPSLQEEHWKGCGKRKQTSCGSRMLERASNTALSLEKSWDSGSKWAGYYVLWQNQLCATNTEFIRALGIHLRKAPHWTGNLCSYFPHHSSWVHSYSMAKAKPECSDGDVCCNTSQTQISINELSAANSIPHSLCWPQWKAGMYHHQWPLDCLHETIIWNIDIAQMKLLIKHLQVYEQLQKVNVIMSHQVTIRLLTKLGTGHDEVVKRWRDALARHVADVHAKVWLV